MMEYMSRGKFFSYTSQHILHGKLLHINENCKLLHINENSKFSIMLVSFTIFLFSSVASVSILCAHILQDIFILNVLLHKCKRLPAVISDMILYGLITVWAAGDL